MQAKLERLLPICLCLVAALYLAPICFILRSNLDQGLLPLGAQVLLSGGYLYKDFHTVVWPLSYMLLAASFKLFGISYLVAKAYLYIELLICVFLLYKISAKILTTSLKFIPPLLFFIVGTPSWGINYYHWDAMLFCLGFALCVLKILPLPPEEDLKQNKTSSPVSTSFYMFTGLLAGLCLSCYQAAGPAMVLGIGAISFCQKQLGLSTKQCLKNLILITAGLSIPLFLLGLYFVLTNTLADMYYSTIGFVFQHYGQVNQVPYGYSLFFNKVIASCPIVQGQEVIAAIRLSVGYLMYLPQLLVIYCPQLCLLGAIIFVIKVFVQEKQNPQIVIKNVVNKYSALLVFAVIGLLYFASQLHRADLARIFWGVQLLIPLMLLFWENLPDKLVHTRLLYKSTNFLLFFCLFIYASFHLSVYCSPIKTYESRRGPVPSIQDLSIVEKLDNITTAGEKILVYPYETTIYFLSNTKFPDKHPLLQYNFNTPLEISSALNDLVSSRVKYAVYDLVDNNDSFSEIAFPGYVYISAENQVVEHFLEKHFDKVKVYGNFMLLKSKDIIQGK